MTWLIKIFASLRALAHSFRNRRNAARWIGCWEAYELSGRNPGRRIAGAGPTTITLPRWSLSAELAFEGFECDSQGHPTRRQTGRILQDQNDSDAATRRGRYLDSAEVYEQRLKMIDKDLILIFPVPASSTLGNVYAPHAWRRKRG